MLVTQDVTFLNTCSISVVVHLIPEQRTSSIHTSLHTRAWRKSMAKAAVSQCDWPVALDRLRNMQRNQVTVGALAITDGLVIADRLVLLKR